MLRVKKAALQGAKVGLTNLWSVFLGYNIVRAVMWLLRTKLLDHRSMKKLNVTQ